MRSFDRRLLRRAAAVLAALSLTVCGGGGKKPADPTDPVSPPPTPTPTPVSPTPQPPLSESCERLPDAATSYTCEDGSSRFQADLDAAVDTLMAERPDIFDGNAVLNVGAFVVGLIKILDRKDICGDWDGEEIGITTNGSFNEQFDVLTSNNLARRYYIGTCHPSVIPVVRPPAPAPPPGCALPGSREVACGKPVSQYHNLMETTIDELLAERPELFDLGDRTDQGWPRVKDMPAYYSAIIGTLADRGLCGMFDGEEIAVKQTNEFTEHFDVNYQDQYVRRGPGIYRGACYPAAF